jgi:RNA polymerase sigma-70 factor, ECF subfamily
VLAIARNLAIDAARRRVHDPRLQDAQAMADEDDRLGGLVWTEALMTLEPAEREIVALHVLGGLTHSEIAAQLDLPPGTVRWKYRVALDRLGPLVSEARDA